MNQKMYLSEHLALPSEATLSQTSKLDGVRLSPHFSLAEMTVTNVKNVVNNPGPEEIENLKRLCGWLEHLRDMYNICPHGCHPSRITEIRHQITHFQHPMFGNLGKYSYLCRRIYKQRRKRRYDETIFQALS